MNTSPNQELKSLHMGEMMYMRERVLWQSKLGLKDPPRLTDIQQLAEDIRNTWPRDNFCGIKIVKHRHAFYRCVKCHRFGYFNIPCLKCGGATSDQPV